MTVTFFGHSNAPSSIESVLEAILTELVQKKDADTFYVGNHGNFDHSVRRTLSKIKKQYPHITYAVVLAYLPTEQDPLAPTDYQNTLYPYGIEQIPRRFAIVWRNKWMIEQSDTVVTYVQHEGGGAARFKKIAERKGKTIINLCT